MKRSGGRRYYRPDDVALVRKIRDLLYEKRYTIEGVQKVIKEKGLKSFLGEEIMPDFFETREDIELSEDIRKFLQNLAQELYNVEYELKQGIERLEIKG